MADFKQAIQWLKEGKKVRHPRMGFDTDYYSLRGTNIFHCRSKEPWNHFDFNEYEATDWEIYKEPEDWTCSKCGKKYKTYAVILDDNPLSIASELEVREQYYDQELKKGLCEECSKEIRK